LAGKKKRIEKGRQEGKVVIKRQIRGGRRGGQWDVERKQKGTLGHRGAPRGKRLQGQELTRTSGRGLKRGGLDKERKMKGDGKEHGFPASERGKKRLLNFFSF